ncbi:MAG: hypothetical protein HZA77_09230 [Candidatus Schekmanbacteria bacterium]|nr:hypothetical protein [Candidatus Schekmanbacteria bacterium]
MKYIDECKEIVITVYQFNETGYNVKITIIVFQGDYRMNLYKEVESIWESNWESNFDERLNDWLKRIKNASDLLKGRGRKEYRNSYPLRLYSSVSGAKDLTFSLRFCGREIAKLNLQSNPPQLEITKEHIKHNNNFGFKEIDKPKSDYNMDHVDIKKIRKYYKTYIDEKGWHNIKTGKPEHVIESRLIEAIERKKNIKIGVERFPNIRLVKLLDFPFQMPLPISASKGRPKKADGHIDILARWGHSGKPKIAILELKKPDLNLTQTKEAIKQLYIYAVTLLFWLRSSHGESLYKFLGYNFSVQLPKKNQIKAVLTICENDKKQLEEAIKSIDKNELPCKFNKVSLLKNDSIKFYVSYYKIDSSNNGHLKLLEPQELDL